MLNVESSMNDDITYHSNSKNFALQRLSEVLVNEPVAFPGCIHQQAFGTHATYAVKGLRRQRSSLQRVFLVYKAKLLAFFSKHVPWQLR